MKIRVLIIHEFYSKNDGSSVALRGYLHDNKDIDYLVLARNVHSEDIKIKEIGCYNDVEEILRSEKFDVIHNFRLKGYTLFRWVLRSMKKLDLNIKIVTTINQRPSFVKCLLSPKEIEHTSVIIFIDNTAKKDSLLSFIPEYRKKCIYYCTSRMDLFNLYYIKRKKVHKHGSHVIFGRGSSVDKCPRDMIDNFNAIPYKDKEFRIVGVPEDSWVMGNAAGIDNIKCIPYLSLEDWYEELMKFDVYLYQIPENSHSSLDSTLGAAMLMGIPVVYYGAEAPKERLKHGINSFVADRKEKIAEYCEMLAQDIDLRIKIGENGHQSNLKQFNWVNTVNSYNSIYSSNKNYRPIKVPLKYKLFFFRTSWRYYFEQELSYICQSRLYQYIRKHLF